MNKLTNIIKKLEARIDARKVKNPTINFEVLMNIVFNVAKDNDVLDLCIVNIITYLCKKYNISHKTLNKWKKNLDKPKMLLLMIMMKTSK